MTDDMEALIEGVALPWLEEAEQSFDTDELAKAGQAVRDLLKAYQERGRPPAPEGEPVAWMDRDVAWDVISDVHKKRWSEINGPEGTQRYSRPLYASPVVPVGMRERVLDELDKAWLHGQRRTSWRRDESADAILAALRPTDTGRE